MDENTIKELTQALFGINGNLDRLARLVEDLNNNIGGIAYAVNNQTSALQGALQGIENEVHDMVENSKQVQADIAEIRAGVDEMR